MNFFVELEKRVNEIDSLLCVGLDPHPQLLPESNAQTARDFCMKLIEATKDYACAFKPNIAFFEIYGATGWEALKEVIASVPEEIPVLLDAKRGDIASTAEAYARAIFDELGAGAVTLNPYLGHDSLQPFLNRPDRGVFLLCKTSNPGADDLQARRLDSGEPLFLHVANLAQTWNQHGNLGLVVGATDVDALRKVRESAPELWILAPGVGAQGGEIETTLAAGLRTDGLGLLIPISRSIAKADDPTQAAEKYLSAIRNARRSIKASHAESYKVDPLADALLEMGCVQFGTFTLKSGQQSPIYFDLRRLISRPQLLQRVAEAYLPIISGLAFDRLAGIPYAGLPIATSIALRSNTAMIYPRKEVKEYGTRAAVEGNYVEGECVVLIDDLATTGGSKFEAIERLEGVGLIVQDVVVLIDRQGGAQEELVSAGYRLHSVYTLTDLIDYWEGKEVITTDQAQEVRAFLHQEDIP